MAGPLCGLKILDLSRILAGPWATQLLADYGAEVWKIEQPEKGDDTRHWGPPDLQALESDHQVSAYFLAANRGKKSVTVDIKSSKGQGVIRALVKHCDVFVENFKVGGLSQYGLDYDSLKKENEKLIYCSITGFGQTGPYCERPGYDAIIQAMGGLMSITGVEEGKPGAGPQKVGVAIADLMTGMYAVSGILAAYIHREKSGQGQHIDLALFDTQLAWLANQNMNYLIGKEEPAPKGSSHPNIVPYQAFPTKSDHIMIAVGNDGQFAKFCQLINLAELAVDERFTTNAARVSLREELLPLITEALLKRPASFWLEQFEVNKVPAAPINRISQVFADEQIKHRKMQIACEHEVLGTVPMVANPVKFSETPIEYHSAPPLLGEHTQSVLDKLKS